MLFDIGNVHEGIIGILEMILEFKQEEVFVVDTVAGDGEAPHLFRLISEKEMGIFFDAAFKEIDLDRILEEISADNFGLFYTVD